MESILISALGLGMVVAGISIRIKQKQAREQEIIRIMEQQEQERILRNLQKSWNAPNTNSEEISWEPEERKVIKKEIGHKTISNLFQPSSWSAKDKELFAKTMKKLNETIPS